jgi:hypothetical protein
MMVLQRPQLALSILGFGIFAAIACALSACGNSSSSGACELYTVADREVFRETFTCEGNVLVTRKFRSGETNACAERKESCTPTGQVCGDVLASNMAYCNDPCSTDADCGPDRFCASSLGMFNGRFVCGVSLPVDSDCTNLDGFHRCAPGLQCLPYVPPGTADDGGSVDASHDPSSEAGAPASTFRLCSKPR